MYQITKSRASDLAKTAIFALLESTYNSNDRKILKFPNCATHNKNEIESLKQKCSLKSAKKVWLCSNMRLLQNPKKAYEPWNLVLNSLRMKKQITIKMKVSSNIIIPGMQFWRFMKSYNSFLHWLLSTFLGCAKYWKEKSAHVTKIRVAILLTNIPKLNNT